MTDHPRHLVSVDPKSESTDDSSSGAGPVTNAPAIEPVTAPITPPRNYENWKRQAFSQGLMEAYHRLGGIEYLVWFGRNYPADFVRALSRMIPQDIRNSIGAEVTIIHTIRRTALDVHPPDQSICDPLSQTIGASEEN